MMVLLLLVLFVFGFYVAHTFHYSRRWSENFHLSLEFSEEQAGEGDVLFLYETAVNNKKMRLPAICVKFQTAKELSFADVKSGTVSDLFYRNDVMSVDGFQKVRRKLRFTCKKRGIYEIHSAELVSYDIFFSHTFVNKLDVSASLCVYPSLIDIERLIPVFRELNGGLATPVPLFEDPYAYAGVRDYTPQDSMRRIHWSASARTGKWQVKTTEYTASAPVAILLNLESPGVFTNTDLMEESIRIAYSLIYYLGSRGITTTLVANADERLCLSGCGRGYMSSVRRALAVMAYRRVPMPGEDFLAGDMEKITPGSRVILISPSGKKPMQELVLSCLQRGVLLTWVAPVISANGADSEFHEMLPGLRAHVLKWGDNG